MIGIFDSGIGGLTVVKEIQRQLPDYKLVYFGDTAHLPYGIKSRDTIIKYSRENVDFLIGKGATIIVIACNTASAIAGPYLKTRLRLPLFDVVSPAVRAAKRVTTNNRIGVIGTPATISSESYQRQLHKRGGHYRVFTQACPLFVPLIEENWLNKKETYSIAEHYLKPLKKRGIDTLILGCTHYPLLSHVIHDIMGKEVTLVSSASELTKELSDFIKNEELTITYGTDEFFVSDEPYRFEKLSRSFLGRPVKVRKVSIENNSTI